MELSILFTMIGNNNLGSQGCLHLRESDWPLLNRLHLGINRRTQISTKSVINNANT
jgi:hypothetical protein